ncbi:Uncharacterised protein [Mycobacterium tuberculosis]|nr:hypothetical protein DSJ90_11855 [Mycobacterium tuberculosis]CMD33201.1 Uncharacterised protein [Mycobacterium tuberculosis]CMT90635.1 Uncharacterised protein [Mycobacterium tuberculosis]
MDTSTAAGRWAKKGANHFDVRLADQALALGGGGGGQLWGQRFTGECSTRSEIGGVGDAPGGVGLGDA